MDAIDQYEWMSKQIARLDERESSPPAPYWFYEDVTEYSEAESFCWACLNTIMPDAKMGEHFGGGWPCEEDGSVVCEKCGALLEYALTEDGVLQELVYFEEYGLDWNNANDCFQLARVASVLFREGEWWDRLFRVFQKASESHGQK